MLRDLTMIFSVLVSVFSLGFGVYKNIEAGNARGFAYEQAYRILGAVEGANIGPAAKASIVDAAFASFATPPPVIDLSRSSADTTVSAEACTEAARSQCIALARSLAGANAQCVRERDAGVSCEHAVALQTAIEQTACVQCFIR
ncbi:MAG: hypothetical protein IT406_00200 [Candidatus Yanofskybacteria bacterium]|nr:hypothetical protein [Candidatus Yanofskybacteria bacterium]